MRQLRALHAGLSSPDEIRHRIEHLQSRIDATDDEATAGPLADELHALLDELDPAVGVCAEVCAVCDHSRYVHERMPADHEFVAGDAHLSPAEHQLWCAHGKCDADHESVMHRSVTASVLASNPPHAAQLDVSTQLFFGVERDGTFSADGPYVWLRKFGEDGYDLTAAEARALAQALQNHADLADGRFIPTPAEQAASLIVSMLAHTGRDAADLHGRVVALVESIVTAMAGAR